MKNRDIDYVDVPEKKECQYKDVPKKNESQYKVVSSEENIAGGGTYCKVAKPAGHTEMRKIARGTRQSTGHSGKAVRGSEKKRAPSAGKILLCMILLVVTGVSYVWMWRLWVGQETREWVVIAALFVYGFAGSGLILATDGILELGIEIATMILLGVGLGVAMTQQIIRQGDFTVLTFINEAGGGFMASIMPLIMLLIGAIG